MIDFNKVFDELPGNFLILVPDSPKFTMLYASKSHLQNLKMSLKDIQGKGIFEVFIDVNNNLKTVKECLEEVIITKGYCKPPKLRYDIPINSTGKFEIRYWDLEYRAICSPTGEVTNIVQASIDITNLIKLGFPL